jgi:L-rhamnose 1-dehydrogenase
VAKAVEAFGKVDVMVSNAGICPFHSFLDMPVETVQRTMQVNLLGGYFMVQAAANQMVKQGHGGAIVAVSSISALVGGEYQTHYTPTKAGLHSLMQSTAIALGKIWHPLQFGAARHDPDRDQQGGSRRRGEAPVYGRARPARPARSARGHAGPIVFLASDMAPMSPARRCWSTAARS